MADLDTLRPEVQEAVAAIDGGNGVFVNSDDGIGSEKWEVARAELLRLADENARLSGRLCLVCGLHNGSQCPQRNDEMSPCTFDPSPVEAAKAFFARATKAEAELAALKARIAEAPVYEIPVTKPRTETGWAGVVESVKNLEALRGKRVRLVVEE